MCGAALRAPPYFQDGWSIDGWVSRCVHLFTLGLHVVSSKLNVQLKFRTDFMYIIGRNRCLYTLTNLKQRDKRGSYTFTRWDFKGRRGRKTNLSAKKNAFASSMLSQFERHMCTKPVEVSIFRLPILKNRHTELVEVLHVHHIGSSCARKFSFFLQIDCF